jgi:hypothetical protein
MQAKNVNPHDLDIHDLLDYLKRLELLDIYPSKESTIKKSEQINNSCNALFVQNIMLENAGIRTKTGDKNRILFENAANLDMSVVMW